MAVFSNLLRNAIIAISIYDFADAADGPAVFIVLIAGFVIVVLALLVELYYKPAYWIHALLWLPLGIGLPLLMLGPLKGMMIGLQYRTNAKEATFEQDETSV